MDRALRLKGALTWQIFLVKLFKICVKESASKDANSNTWRREGKVKHHKETSSKISNHLCMAAMTKRNWYQRNWVWRSITNFFLSTTSPQTPSFLSKNSLVIFFSWLTSCYSYWVLLVSGHRDPEDFSAKVMDSIWFHGFESNSWNLMGGFSSSIHVEK